MKNLLLILFLSIPIWMLGQSIKIFDNSGTRDLTNGQDTVLCSSNDYEIAFHLKVKNTGSGNVNIYAKKRIVSTIIPGTVNKFCWANACYPENVYVSTNFASMGPNSTDTTFIADYYPNGNSGITVITYTFYPDHGSDSSTVTVTFDLPAGIETNIANVNFISNPSPNPANTFTSFNYYLKSGKSSYVTIHNILGDEIKRTVLNIKYGTFKVNTSDLPSGLYFCSFFSEGKVIKTQKFTVAR